MHVQFKMHDLVPLPHRSECELDWNEGVLRLGMHCVCETYAKSIHANHTLCVATLALRGRRC